MSKHVPIGNVVEGLKGALHASGAATLARPAAGLIASIESLDDGQKQTLAQTRNEFRDIITQAMASIGIENMGFDVNPENYRSKHEATIAQYQRENALSAAAIVAMAAGDPVKFARAALESKFEAAPGAPMITPTSAFGAAGSMDYRDQSAWTLEAYDNKNLTDFLPYSIAFNIYGQRQDEFSELLFKTFVVPPEQAGVEITASRLLVYRDQNHTSASGYNMGKRNLIEAHVDHTLLQDESTRLVPVAATDNSNDTVLVATTLVATSYLQLGGVSVPTRPIKIGVPVDLIKISQYQPLVGAGLQFDNQDTVDSAIRLQDIVVNTGVASAPAVVFNTLTLPGHQFQRALSGNYREMNLNFETQGLVVTKDTTAVDGSSPAAFASIPTGWSITLGVSINGKVNVEKGNCTLTASALVVTGAYDANGNPQSLTSGSGAAVVTALAAYSVAGYDLLVNRTNSNRRTRGLRIDTTLVRERYYIPLAAPISVARPNDPWQQAQATDLKAIVTTARIRNTNNAITALFNIVDALESYITAPFKAGEDDSSAIGGLGRLLVNPYFQSVPFDLVTALNSVSSAVKAEDIQGALVNKIRDVAFDMLQKSNYQPALEAQLGGPSAKPILFVGTDQVLIRWLMVTGDDRTFTPMFDSAIVKESLDNRMYGKIFLTFVRPDANEPDLLSFGAHIWSTELVSTLQVTRSGESNSIETMVQPRTLHINMMPVCAMITVSGLATVAGTAAVYNVLNTVQP